MSSYIAQYKICPEKSNRYWYNVCGTMSFATEAEALEYGKRTMSQQKLPFAIRAVELDCDPTDKLIEHGTERLYKRKSASIAAGRRVSRAFHKLDRKAYAP